ncbi:hypothetical protein [Chitinivorax sp. B]|uniref:hypothetical protein n=1 Tax=Chitinivorax sp. B TaxID=2502235 RepID=UPI0010FA3C59|nr:hypothetical protein [Chitinivorax sp. B]
MSEFLLILTAKDQQGQFRVRLDFGLFGIDSFTASKIRSCDLDRSYVLQVGAYEALSDALRIEFAGFDFYQSVTPASIWKRIVERGDRKPFDFLAEDNTGRSIAQRMVEFIYLNRHSLGDDGTWQVWKCRDLLLNRSGTNLSDMAHAEQKRAASVKALPDADYTDELGSFRFPSTSCLYGVSQPLSQLRGAVKFCKLFIQDGAGVYVAFHDDEVLYVGMSQRFSQRLSNAEYHHKLKLVLERHPQARVAVIHYPFWKLPSLNDAVTSEEKDAAWGRIRELLFGLERACIEYYQPRYNGMLDEDDDASSCDVLSMQFASSRSQPVALAGA